VLKRGFHFEVDQHTDLPSAQLGELVTNVIRAHQTGDVIIVHVLTHGLPNPDFYGIFAIGSDGTCNNAADVKKWLDACAEYGSAGPHVLFLLDLCHAGEAVLVDDNMIEGHLFFHLGNDSTFRAEPFTPAD